MSKGSWGLCHHQITLFEVSSDAEKCSGKNRKWSFWHFLTALFGARASTLGVFPSLANPYISEMPEVWSMASHTQIWCSGLTTTGNKKHHPPKRQTPPPNNFKLTQTQFGEMHAQIIQECGYIPHNKAQTEFIWSTELFCTSYQRLANRPQLGVRVPKWVL
jgi:hypothetical protein